MNSETNDREQHDDFNGLEDFTPTLFDRYQRRVAVIIYVIYVVIVVYGACRLWDGRL